MKGRMVAAKRPRSNTRRRSRGKLPATTRATKHAQVASRWGREGEESTGAGMEGCGADGQRPKRQTAGVSSRADCGAAVCTTDRGAQGPGFDSRAGCFFTAWAGARARGEPKAARKGREGMNACGAVGWTPARQSGDPGSNPKGGDFITMVARGRSTGGGIKQAAGEKGAPRGSKKNRRYPEPASPKKVGKKGGEGAVRAVRGGGGWRVSSWRGGLDPPGGRGAKFEKGKRKKEGLTRDESAFNICSVRMV